MNITRCLLLFAILCPAFSGCSKGTSSSGDTKVNGIVTFAGKPVTYGKVEFHLANGQILKAAISSDGSYSLFKPPTGEAKIAVILGNPPVAAAPMTPGEKPPTFDKLSIPAKYADPSTTTLRAAIQDGPQTIPIDIPAE